VSRTLKRPMFRRGGTVNDGIMTGLEDREKLQAGTRDPAAIGQSARELIEQFEPLLREFTPKTKLPLGQVGFALASGVDPLKALGAGYSQFVKADDAREAAIRKSATSLGLGQALKDATPSKSMLANMKKAKIDLEAEFGRGNFTREQVVKLASEYNKADLVGKGPNPDRIFEAALAAAEQELGTKNPNKAYNATVYSKRIMPKLREQGRRAGGRLSKNKDGTYKTPKIPDAYYIDVDLGEVIYWDGEKYTPVTEQYANLF
jgi:hypothetical protein